MMIFAVIFILFVLYTLGCIADGPDVKPLLRRWLGEHLLGAARKYIRVYECIGPDKCGFVKYEKDKKDYLSVLCQQQEARIGAFIDCISKLNASRADGTILLMEHKAIISEYDVSRVHCQYGFFGKRAVEEEINRLIAQASQSCIDGLVNPLKDMVVINVDRESDFPNIIVNGKLIINRQV
ncbi:hypothetical protein [Prevotella sp. E2-28]|uniref:hypothetical protein n=1 Tax=Prevotella sp. E2-28 TaxID=2913620 RepID=UPI001EDA9795|nr:hypothetical protein [Prevotella sp. E2-28]UKK52686.1 hypothetical protein L6465_08720 [Prevotella sp. E2-28]